MKPHIHRLGFVVLLLTVLVTTWEVLSAQEPGKTPPAAQDQMEEPIDGPPPEDGIEIQTRGPVHEAYAQPVDTDPKPGPVVSKKPPAPIPESPPEARPEGENVLWIPGYWSWDQERKDYLWVSGFWRAPPPGRKWVPGHWTQAEDGYQWVAGFWAPDSQIEAQYLPEPPPSQENGPSTPSPIENAFYVPGCWSYQDARYTWQPGYWAEPHPGYVWIPSYYTPTPLGSLYVPGYWDLSLDRRGLLFAPVFFNRPLWLNPGWTFRPSFWVGPRTLLSSLWVGSAWRHYYFGNFYGSRFASWGFRPWFNFSRGFGDPLFNYYRWSNRGDPNWQRNLVNIHNGRLNGTVRLPPSTFAQQNRFLRAQNVTNVTVNKNINNSIHVAQSIQNVHNNFNVTRLNQTQVNQARTMGQSFRQVTVQRQNIERRVVSTGARPKTLNLQHVPVGNVRTGGPAPHPPPRPSGGGGHRR
jgi:hypothetical protein